MTVSAVSPTAQKPKHHVTLSDGSTTVGLIAVQTSRNKGEIVTVQDENAIDVSPSQPLAIQTSQGNSQYSDREWPYMTLVQDDWSGGRGGETFEDDKSRYYDGERVNTWREGALVLGPMETYTINSDAEQYMPGDTSGSGVTWGVLYGDSRYWATKWTQDGTWTHDQNIEVIVRKIGSPGKLTLRLAADSAGVPGAVLGSDPFVVGENDGSTLEANKSYVLTIGCDANVELTDTNDYHIEVYGAWDDAAADHWEVATATGTSGGKVSSAQVSYASARTLYYRILGQFTDATKWATSWVTFEYKGALYAYSQPPSGNSYLYINGDRGVADDNTADLTFLEDADSKGWVQSEFVGCIVKIIAGPGSEEYQPWRTIIDNDVNSLECDTDWNLIHTTSTEYIIIGSDKWTSLLDLGGYVTGHAVTADYVYFARGETSSDDLLRYQWYKTAGAEATRNEAENIDGKYLLAVHHPEDEDDTLYIAQNNNAQYGVAIGKMKVPGTWNDLVYSMGQLAYTNTPWADRSIANVTQTTDDQATKISLTDTFVTGLIAVQNLEQPVDITRANQLGFWLYSNTAFASGELYLQYDDFRDGGGDTNFLIKKAVASAFTEWDNTSHNALWKSFDGEPSTEETIAAFETDHAFYVVGNFKYDTILIDMGATKNDVESVMTADYFDGKEFTSITITDGTISSAKTLATDGSITFTPPANWQQYKITDDTADSGAAYSFTGYIIRLKVSVNLTASINIAEVSLSRSNQLTINLGTIPANEWIYIVKGITPEKFPAPDDTQIQSLALYIEDDKNANIVIRMNGGIDLLYNEPDWKPLPSDEKITNMIAHNGNVNEPRTNPWIFTEGAQIYEMQSQNEDQFIPITIGEMGSFRSENTGRAACVNDVYLYFSLGEERLERWFNNSLEDIGPDGEYYYGVR